MWKIRHYLKAWIYIEVLFLRLCRSQSVCARDMFERQVINTNLTAFLQVSWLSVDCAVRKTQSLFNLVGRRKLVAAISQIRQKHKFSCVTAQTKWLASLNCLSCLFLLCLFVFLNGTCNRIENASKWRKLGEKSSDESVYCQIGFRPPLHVKIISDLNQIPVSASVV